MNFLASLMASNGQQSNIVEDKDPKTGTETERYPLGSILV